MDNKKARRFCWQWVLGLSVVAGIVAPSAYSSAAKPPAALAQPKAAKPLPKTTLGTLVVDGYVPDFAAADVAALEPYQNIQSSSLVGFSGRGDEVYLKLRPKDTYQLFRLAQPQGQPEPLTSFAEPIGAVAVSDDPKVKELLFLKDVGGSEDDQIFALDPETKKSRQLTHGAVRHRGLKWFNKGSRFLFSSNERNGKDTDIWLFDLTTMKKRRLTNQPGAYHVVCINDADNLAVIRRYISSTASEMFLLPLDQASPSLTPMLASPGQDEIAYGEAVFNRDGSQIYFTWDRDHEFQVLMRYRLDSKVLESIPLALERPWDIEGLGRPAGTDDLVVVVNREGYSDVYAVAGAKPQAKKIQQVPEGVLRSLRFHPSKPQKLAFAIATSKSPTDIYQADLASGKTTAWHQWQGSGLKADSFVAARLIHYPSFDKVAGKPRQIPAFIYEPANARGKRPVLIYIHGGPESQFRPGFSAEFQFLVRELGMTVIATNVRGSAGYGKSYLKLDNGYLREDSVKDIGALLDWLPSQSRLDPKKVVVSGGSYGGYMVLATLVHYSDRLLAGIDRVGISNFVTFLTNTRDYRRDLRRVEYGDERDANMRAFLEKISPLTNAEKITKPLFIVQGQNDPRVPASEALQMVKRIRAQGGQVWYLLAQDEGHGFKKRRNRDFYQSSMVKFLRQLL